MIEPGSGLRSLVYFFVSSLLQLYLKFFPRYGVTENGDVGLIVFYDLENKLVFLRFYENSKHDFPFHSTSLVILTRKEAQAYEVLES
jgi:hypothetical protein